MVEERWLLGASAYLMVPPAPVVTTATTGGTVAAGTYWVKVTAKNAQGETTGSAASKIVTTGATSTITVTIFTVPNATQYSVYIGSGGTLPADSAMWPQAATFAAVQRPPPGAAPSSAWSNAASCSPSAL
jgi:hypothetical protein